MKKIYWLFLPLFFTQCEKPDSGSEFGYAIAYGYLTDWETGDTVKSCTIELYKHFAGNAERIENFSYQQKTIVDENGFFLLPFIADSRKYYGLRAIKENYVETRHLNRFTINPKEAKEVFASVARYSWLLFHIEDVPELQGDSVYFYDEGLRMLPGTDTSFVMDHDRRFDNYYIWDVFHAGVATREFFTGYSCPPFDTCTIHIPF